MYADSELGPRGETLPLGNEGRPPDSFRRSGLCPRCGVQSSFEAREAEPISFDLRQYVHDRRGGFDYAPLERVSVLHCRHCRQGVAVVEEKWLDEEPARTSTSGGTVSWRGIFWWPFPSATVPRDVPEVIGQIFAEAAMCLGASCYRASAVMARRALEAITHDKGATKDTLAKRLKELADSGVLHPSLAEWVTEIRLVGNVGAHFDPIEDVSEDEARELVNFLRELLRFLYELPGELARRRSQK